MWPQDVALHHLHAQGHASGRREDRRRERHRPSLSATANEAHRMWWGRLRHPCGWRWQPATPRRGRPRQHPRVVRAATTIATDKRESRRALGTSAQAERWLVVVDEIVKAHERRASRDGARGTRTPDLLGAIQALSQLSYSPRRTRWCVASRRARIPADLPI